MRKVLLGDTAKASAVTFNEARAHFGLKPIYNITELVRGDITLLPDMPILSGLPEEELTPGYYYTGPIFSKLDMPIDEEIKKVFSRPGINIFCSLGSSGFPETLKLIISTLKKEEEREESDGHCDGVDLAICEHDMAEEMLEEIKNY